MMATLPSNHIHRHLNSNSLYFWPYLTPESASNLYICIGSIECQSESCYSEIETSGIEAYASYK